MSEPFVGEIRLVGFNFAPENWAFCNGQTLPISEYNVLFALIGTTYGGDGQTTFALPNLQSRVVVHQGSLAGGGSYVMGQSGGVEAVTISTLQMASHTHGMVAQGANGTSSSPAGAYFAGSQEGQYAASANGTGTTGAILQANPSSNQPHSNLQPYLALNYIICLNGIYPTRN